MSKHLKFHFTSKVDEGSISLNNASSLRDSFDIGLNLIRSAIESSFPNGNVINKNAKEEELQSIKEKLLSTTITQTEIEYILECPDCYNNLNVICEQIKSEDNKPYLDLLAEAGISNIIISSGDKEKETITIDMSKDIDDSSNGDHYYPDLLKGMNCLNDIINRIMGIIKSSGNQSKYYGKPKFVFRGITRYYDDDGKGSEEKNIKRETRKVEQGFIKSSLAVRIRDTSKDLLKDKEEYRKISYINALEDLIRKAKKMYPGNYTTGMSDLDILADIQHNGGATGLVDFSKNLLTSIWFACNADPKYNGYVYCYNYMEDMIIRDALAYVRPEDENMKISELLLRTNQEVNICSDKETKFYFWEPSKKNNRIARQDSVFVFGLEKFKVSAHNIKVIPIPAKHKSAILTAIKAIFNISGNSVYSDYIGFASNNNKLRPYKKLSDSAYSRGYDNMIKGHYDSALRYLKRAELEFLQIPGQGSNPGKKKEVSPGNWDKRKEMELHFSLAVCYKKISRQNDTIKYLENAIFEYKKAIAQSIELYGQSSNNDKEYYRLKIFRAYESLFELRYDLHRYEDAIDTCYEIIEAIKRFNEAFKGEDKDKYTPKYCYLCINELVVLNIFKSIREGTSNHGFVGRVSKKVKELIGNHDGSDVRKNTFDAFKDRFYKSDLNNSNEENNNCDFFYLLNEYYYTLYKIIKNKNGDMMKNTDVNQCIKKWQEDAERIFEKSADSSNSPNKIRAQYITWNLSDIISEIDMIKEGNRLLRIKSELKDLTAVIISIRDLFTSQDWQTKDEI